MLTVGLTRVCNPGPGGLMGGCFGEGGFSVALESQEVGVGTSSWPGIQPGPAFYAEGRLLSPSPEMGQRPASEGGWSSQRRGVGPGPGWTGLARLCAALRECAPPGKGPRLHHAIHLCQNLYE